MIGRSRGGGTVDAAVTVAGPDAFDQLRSLQEWLGDVDELRGRVGSRESAPERGTLGPVLDALAVALGPGGAATALATAVIAWLRSRRGEVRVKVTLPDDRSVELTARRIAGLDADALRQQVDQVAAMLDDGSDEPRRLDR